MLEKRRPHLPQLAGRKADKCTYLWVTSAKKRLKVRPQVPQVKRWALGALGGSSGGAAASSPHPGGGGGGARSGAAG